MIAVPPLRPTDASLRLLIRRFDGWLSRLEGVQPFTDDPRVILRLQEGRLAWDVPLPDGTLCRRSSVMFVHLWNDRIPPISPAGPDMVWALRTQRALVYSFRAVAGHLIATPRLDSIKAVGGTLAQIRLGRPDGGRALLEHLGFTIFPYRRPAGAFGEFWENFYTWSLMWAFNPPSAARRGLLSLRRTEFWTTTSRFRARFGEA